MHLITVSNATLHQIANHADIGKVFRSTATDNGDGTSTFPVSDDVAERLRAIHDDPDIAIGMSLAALDGRLN